MPFEPLTNYRGYRHVPEAGAVWFHPNGTAYCCACEKDENNKQDLTVYRKRHKSAGFEKVIRYEGGVHSENQMTMGGAAINPIDGSLLVVTSLIIPGAPYVTYEKFQGSWIEEPSIDEPWSIAGGGGGTVLFDRLYTHPEWEGRLMNGGAWVHVPSTFGVPNAPNYIARICITAEADVRLRCGTFESPALYTINTQVANIQMQGQGRVPGPNLYVSTTGPGRVWVQIAGREKE